MVDNVLPVSTKRRGQREQIETVNVDDNEVRIYQGDDGNRVNSVVNSLPELISLTKDIVNIYKSRVDTENTLQLMDKELERLRFTTEDYVKKELSDRETLTTRGDFTLKVLSELTNALKNGEMSEEIQRVFIKTFSESIEKMWYKNGRL